MVNWQSPEEVERDSRVLSSTLLVLNGVALWDVLKTFSFDWAILTRRRPWKWPMTIYFLCRISMLLHISAAAASMSYIAELNCQAFVYLSLSFDGIGTVCSSFILALRTYAVWERNPKIGFIMLVGIVGQIIFWCDISFRCTARWNRDDAACELIHSAPNELIVANFTFTMVFDFLVLALCAFKLYRSKGIGALLLRDGIIYFLVVATSNMLQVIFASLMLNSVMNIIAVSFALVASVIASTTAFRNLVMYHSPLAAPASPSDIQTIGIPTSMPEFPHRLFHPANILQRYAIMRFITRHSSIEAVSTRPPLSEPPKYTPSSTASTVQHLQDEEAAIPRELV